LRVCFISSYPPNRGRLSEYGQNLVKAIAKRPAVTKIYVVADKARNSQERPAENSKIEVLRVWKPDFPLSIVGILWHVLKIKPHIIHFNIHFQSYGKTRLANFVGFALILLFSKMFRLKTIVLLHNLAEKVDLQKVRLKPSFVNKAGILIATKLVLSASCIVVTVESYVQYLKRRYGHKEIWYIPHGTSATNRIPIDYAEKVLLMFGHMGPSKGLPIIFRAFENLSKEMKNVKLVVAGDSHPNFPNYLNEMKRVAPQAVDFLGYVQEEDIAKVFSRADVVVLPYSTATGTSGVFHIACSYGKPIVATSLPEIRELVTKGASAILVPSGNREALKKAILRILCNKSLANKMSEQNLTFAKREQWPAVAESYEKAYLKLLNYRSLNTGRAQVSVTVPACETPNLYERFE